MAHNDIALQRLFNQQLLGSPLANPEEVVNWLGAVQAQDYAGAKWAIGQRVRDLYDADIDQLFDAGKILRTHVMRPTWHFVLPADIRWLLQLTAPRVKQLMGYYNRKLELDAKLLLRTNNLITKALAGDNYLTRTELAEVLRDSGIEARGQRLGHIVFEAELDALICSGPRRGKQFTYALLDERAPKVKALDHDEALAELATRYFRSHGPALAQDFAWWSGLSVGEAKKSIDLVNPKLNKITIGNNTYWFAGSATIPNLKKPTIHLLPNYDEYLISYKDYSPIFSEEVKKLNKPFGNALLAHIVVRDGKVIGGWRREIKKTEVMIRTDLLVKLNKAERAALAAEKQRYARFFNLKLST